MYFLYIGLRTVMLHSKPKYTAVHKQAFRTLSLTHTHSTHPEGHWSRLCTTKSNINKGEYDLNFGVTSPFT